MCKQIFSITALAVACLMALPALAASSLTPVSDSYEYSISGDEHPTPYLGVDTRDLTPERVTALHLKDEQGVEVTMVDQDAPAGKAGIKEHDVITQVNGQNVESVEQLRRLIHEIPAGRTVTIGLIRNGKPLALKAELASRNETFDIHIPEPMNLNLSLHDLPNVRDWDIPVSVVVVHSALHSGLMIENLNQQLSTYFGVKNGRGILVRSVEKGSLAEKSGFRAGDVIVKVNGTPVSDSSDFSRALRSRKGQLMNVIIIRDRKEQQLTFTLPEHSQSGTESFPQTSKIEQQINFEMARVRPQIEMAMQQARQAANQIRQSFDKEEFKQQVEEFRRQEQKQHQQLEMEMRKLHEKLSMGMNAI